MMTGTITDDQAKALAYLMAAAAGEKHWDVAGIRAGISQARHRAPMPELVIAAMRIAADPTVRTPAVLAMDGPHWRDLEQAARTQRPADARRCDVEGHEYALLPCRMCASEAKAHPDDAPKGINQHADDHEHAYTVGPALARQAMRQAGIPTNGEPKHPEACADVPPVASGEPGRGDRGAAECATENGGPR